MIKLRKTDKLNIILNILPSEMCERILKVTLFSIDIEIQNTLSISIVISLHVASKLDLYR